MKRRKGIVWLITGIILALFAGLLTFRLLSGMAPTSVVADQAVTVPVVVARTDVPMRTLLTDDMVEIQQMPPELVPAGAASTLDQVLGKISKTDLVAGEVLLIERLADPAKKGVDILFTMPEDKIVIALPADDLMSRTGLLRPGDKVDILCSLEIETSDEEQGIMGTGKLVTFSALQNQEITGIVLTSIGAETAAMLETMTGGDVGTEGQEKIILLAVDPQDALLLKHLKDAGGIVDFALRAPTNEQFMRTEPVMQDYLIDRYQMALD